ncbi:MAG: hypothetical protein C0594_16670, partial [Marinilabiliales bacterium]
MVKIFFPHNNWGGGFVRSVKKALDELGCDTYMPDIFEMPVLHRAIKKFAIKGLLKNMQLQKDMAYNNYVISEIEKYKPDYF